MSLEANRGPKAQPERHEQRSVSPLRMLVVASSTLKDEAFYDQECVDNKTLIGKVREEIRSVCAFDYNGTRYVTLDQWDGTPYNPEERIKYDGIIIICHALDELEQKIQILKEEGGVPTILILNPTAKDYKAPNAEELRKYFTLTTKSDPEPGVINIPIGFFPGLNEHTPPTGPNQKPFIFNILPNGLEKNTIFNFLGGIALKKLTNPY